MRTPDLDNLKLTDSYPELDPSRLTNEQRALWQQLPESYQGFLKRNNGGFLDDPHLCFRTCVPLYQDGRIAEESQVDAVVEFFGLHSTVNAQPRTPRDLLELRALHDAEDFLPRGIVAIASCPGGSLVCLSTSPVDFGAVFFWDYYWRYPWSKPFFQLRLQAAEQRFPDLEPIRRDPGHPKHQEAQDTLNYSTLVRIGCDFREWLKSCWLDTEVD